MKLTCKHTFLLCMIVLMACGPSALGKTYYIRPDGKDTNPGTSNTAKGAWRSLSRGQPTQLAEATEKGRNEIIVKKNSHFPRRGVLVINNRRVRYSGKAVRTVEGRDVRVFTGCRNVPKAAKGTLVGHGGFKGFKPGDIIEVAKGAYRAKLGADREAMLEIFTGGSKNAPLVYRAKGRVILDCRGNFANNSIAVRSSNVVIDGFECRRNGGVVVQGDNVEITRCRINGAEHAIYLAHHTKNVKIHHNIIFAMCSYGVLLDNVNGATIHHNTLHGIRRPIALKNNSRKINIHHNLISRSKYEAIVFKGKQTSDSLSINNNNLWANRTDVWLRTSSAYGKGVQGGKGNTHDVPMIASYNIDSPNFFAFAKGSPLPAKNIGARGFADKQEPLSRLERSVSSTRNLLNNPSFEAGLTNWKYSTAGRHWDNKIGVRIDNKHAYAGKKSVCLFMTGEIPSRPSLTASIVPLKYGNTYTLSVYARTDTPGKAAASVSVIRPSWHSAIRAKGMRLSSSKLTKKWQRFSHTFKLDYKWAEDGMVVLTARYGKVWFDCIQLEEGTEATSYGEPVELTFTTAYPGNLVPPGKTIQCAVANTTNKAVSGDLTIRFEDIWDKLLFEKKLSLNPAPGKLQIENITMPPQLSGLVFARWHLSIPVEKYNRRSVFRFAVGQKAPITDDYFFASTPHMEHLPHDWVARFGAAIGAYGVTTFRAYLGERDFPHYTKKGITRYDRYLRDGKKYGINMLVTLDNEHFWKKGKRAKGDPWVTDERVRAWTDMVAPFVKRYGNRIKVWEVTNESNCYTPQEDGAPFDAEQYLRIFKPTCKAIKDAHPDNKVLGCSITIHYGHTYTKDVITRSAPFYDGLSFHPYGGEWRLLPALDALRGYQKKAGREKPIWFTEEYSMVPSAYDRVSWPYDAEDVQSTELQPMEVEEAMITSRLYLISLAEGVKSYTYHTYPALITDSAYTPHARLKALHTMKVLLGRAKPLRRLELGKLFEGYVFKDDKGQAIVTLWPEDYIQTKPVKITVNGAIDKAYDFVGGPVEVTTGNGSIISLPRSITYCISKSASAEDLARAFEKAVSGLAE